MMKKFCKVGFYLAAILTSVGALADCQAPEGLRIEAPNTTIICKPHVEVFFGYSNKLKSPVWALYTMRASLAASSPVYMRYNGSHSPIMEISLDEQLQPEQITSSGQSKGYLVPHFNVLDSASQSQKFNSMVNVVPVKKSDWIRHSSDLMFDLGANERLLALKKGDFSVLSGVIYDEDTIMGIPSAKYIYKVYYHNQYDYTLSYLVPVSAQSSKVDDYITSIQCIEKLSGHRLFSGFPDELKESIKSGVAYDKNHWASPNSKESECALVI